MSSINRLLRQWHTAGHLDTSDVPRDELAITLVLLFLRDESYQNYRKARYPAAPADLSFQHKILVELYAHRFLYRDLELNRVVVETVCEYTLVASPLDRFLMRCREDAWRRGEICPGSWDSLI